MQLKNNPSGEPDTAQRKHSFPVWLFCLLLFVLLAFLSARLVPSFLQRYTATAASIPAEEAALSSGNSDSGEKLSPEEAGIPDEASPAASLPAESDAGSDISSSGSPESAGSVTAEAAVILTDEPAALPEDAAPEDAALSASGPEPAVSEEGYGIPEWGHIHRYQNGICSVCGQTPEFCTDFLPHEFYEETGHAGTVELHRYEIPAYSNGGYGTYNKCFNIYLPWNYDEAKRYNVLVLVHGGGGNQDSWLNDVYPYKDEGIEMCGRVLLDNMFEKGICEPCIVICPVTEIPQCQGLLASTNQLRQELREYILPYVAEHYSTYAADSSIDAIRAARDHFGLGGLSNGALFVYEGGMRYNYDLFGSYAAFSGNGEPWTTVTKIKQTDQFKNLTMNCYFTGAGTQNDWQQNYTEIGYEYFLENLPYLQDGKNAWHVDVEGEHEWKVWFTDLFNALPLMFPS